MEPEDQLEWQVSNLELSKKLKELGVKQESFFKYEIAFHNQVSIIYKNLCICPHFDTSDVREYYSAFTVAELYNLHIEKFKKCYIRPNIAPEYLADYLAQSYIDKLLPEVL